MKSIRGIWNALINDEDNENEGEIEKGNILEPELDIDLGSIEGEGAAFLEEAYEALNKLSQKTNKRGKQMRQPKRADSWQ